MKRKEKRITPLNRMGSLKLGKILLICSILIFLLVPNELECVKTCEGFIEKAGSFPLTEGEYFCRVIVHNDCTCLFGGNFTEQVEDRSYFMDILNVSNLANPTKIERFDFTLYGYVQKAEIKDDILYTFTTWFTETVGGFHLLLFNISNPTSPWLIGDYREENTTIPWDFALYQNYAFMCTNTMLKIIDCTNKSAPTLAVEQLYPAEFIEISEDVLYLLFDKIQTFNLTNPKQPTLIGEYTGEGKSFPVSMVVKDKFVYTGHRWDGLLVIDFTDPPNPKRAAKYSFPNREFASGGEIEAIAIFGDYLFTCGSELYLFKIKNPNFIRRIAKIDIAIQGLTLFADEKAIFVISNYLEIFSFQKPVDYLLIGLSIGGGMVVIGVIGTILIFYKRKKKKNNGEKHQ